MSYLMKILTTFAMSMVPVVELRGGIPYGLSRQHSADPVHPAVCAPHPAMDEAL